MPESAAVQKSKESTTPQTLAKTLEAPFERVEAIFDDIARRAFGFFESDGRIMGRDLDHWFRAEQELLRPVRVELTETDAAYEIKAEVPGFNENELEIKVEPHRVVLAGRHEAKTTEEKKGEVVRSESSTEQFLRIVELPAHADTGKATATLAKSGILTLTLPKTPTAAAVRIKPVAS